jgi:uncharacterized protein
MNQSRVNITLWQGIGDVLIITGMFLLGLVIAPLFALLPLSWYYGISFQSTFEFIQLPSLRNHADGRYVLFYLQAFTALGAFFLSSGLYLNLFERNRNFQLQSNPNFSWQSFSLVILITLAIMPLNSMLIEWNTHMKFPSFMAGFERWAKEQEEQLGGLTQYLTEFGSQWDLLWAMIVIAVIPALGEELLFRGLLQNKLAQFLNVHTAIWIAGFVFSAIHLQFYGFFPRWLLGVLFGYMYVWSGNLWIPIMGHFFNNGFTLCMLYLYKQKITELNIDTNASMPLSYILVSTVLTSFMLYYFYQINQKASKR